MMKRALSAAALAFAMLAPASASAQDELLVCRGGKFRMIVHAKDQGPEVAFKFGKYSTSKPFVKNSSGKYPYDKLKVGRCAVLDRKLPTKAETHFLYAFKSPVDICSTFLFPKYKTKDVHLDFLATKKTSFVDKSFILGFSRSDLLFKLKVFVANKGTNHAYFVVKQPLGAYQRATPEKLLYGAEYVALAGSGSSTSKSCMPLGVQKYFKVK